MRTEAAAAAAGEQSPGANTITAIIKIPENRGPPEPVGKRSCPEQSQSRGSDSVGGSQKERRRTGSGMLGCYPGRIPVGSPSWGLRASSLSSTEAL